MGLSDAGEPNAACSPEGISQPPAPAPIALGHALCAPQGAPFDVDHLHACLLKFAACKLALQHSTQETSRVARWGGDDPRPRTPMKERAYPTVQACKFGRSGDRYFRKLLPKNKWWVHRPGVTPPSVSESFYFLKPAVTQPSTWLDTHVRSPNPSRRLLRAGPRRGRTSTPGFYLVCKITLFCRREPLCQCAIISL